MVGVLTVSTAASPFPYAAIAIATYTQKAEVNFDEEVKLASLALDGINITGEDEIVRTLAKAGGLADDSANVSLVCQRFTHRSDNLLSAPSVDAAIL